MSELASVGFGAAKVPRVMTKKNLVTLSIMVCFLLLGACSQNTVKPIIALSDTQKLALYQQAQDLFINESDAYDVLSFAEVFANFDKRSTSTIRLLATPFSAANCTLESSLNPSAQNPSAENPSAESPSAENLSLFSYSDNTEHPAKLARLDRKTEQFIAFQFLAFGNCMLSDSDVAHLRSSPSWSMYFNALAMVSDGHKVLREGLFSLYEADDELGLLAFSLQHDTSRAFVAFNLSYNVQAIPLPFGFMASTKVTLWQSDAIEPITFVSTGPLMMRPFTVSIVLVN